MAKFAANPNREQAMQALREGKTVEDIIREFKLPMSTATRYATEVKNPKPQKLHTIKNTKTVKAEPPAEPEDIPPEEPTEDTPKLAPQSQSEKKTVAAGIPKQVTGQANLATVAAKSPAPIVFVMGDLRIDLNPAHFYDAYRYYEDIKRMNPAIDDDFSLAVKASMKHVWEIISRKEAARVGVAIQEDR